jgi:hypothetical protein
MIVSRFSGSRSWSIILFDVRQIFFFRKVILMLKWGEQKTGFHRSAGEGFDFLQDVRLISEQVRAASQKAKVIIILIILIFHFIEALEDFLATAEFKLVCTNMIME